MDILAPQLMWIGGRCYRVNKTNESIGAGTNPAAYEDEIAHPVLEQYIEKGITIEQQIPYQIPKHILVEIT